MGDWDDLAEFNYFPDRVSKSAKQLRAVRKNARKLLRGKVKWRRQLAHCKIKR